MKAALLLAALCAPAAASTATAKDDGLFIYWKDDLPLVVKTQQQKLPRQRELHSHLGIKPGMTILDIGSGTGQQAYLLAETLKGTGKVYASDIEPRLVDYVNAQAKERGLDNLEAFLVKPEGLDEAYAKHAYDLVILYDVFAFIRRPADYFRKLRALLKPGGRVAVVFEPKFAFAFSRDDFADWDGFVAEVLREPAGTPFDRVFSSPLRESLASLPPRDEVARRRAVLHHLNFMLIGNLFKEFTVGLEFKPDVSFTPQERPFASWLLHRLHLAGIEADRNRMEMIVIESRDQDMLNKLLIIQRYRKYFHWEGRAPYDSRSWESKWFLERDNVRAAFEAAGYGPGVKHDLLPFQRIWVFPKEKEEPAAATPPAPR